MTSKKEKQRIYKEKKELIDSKIEYFSSRNEPIPPAIGKIIIDIASLLYRAKYINAQDLVEYSHKVMDMTV